MLTTVEIDADLLRSTMETTGIKSEEEVVTEALKLLIAQLGAQQQMRALRGKIAWDGDLDAMRKDKPVPAE